MSRDWKKWRKWFGLSVAVVAGCGVFFIPWSLRDPVRVELPFLNGVWVDAFNQGIFRTEEIDQLVQDIDSAGINAVFLQVRRRGDLLFDSDNEPRMNPPDQTGGFDPVNELQQRLNEVKGDVQLHGWVVCGPVWNRKSIDRLPEDHVLRSHPDWRMVRDDGETWDDGEYYLDLGLPQVQKHLQKICAELAASGRVDGIHLDYIRYPGRNWGYHPEVIREFQTLYGTSGKPAPDDSRWMAFRRDKISDLVASIYCRIKSIDPTLILSAATITFAPGPDKASDWFYTSAYAYLFQDWKSWLDRGILDWAIPMCYFNETRHADNYRKWVDFLSQWESSSRVAIGQALYLNSFEDNFRQFEYSLTHDAILGRFLGVVGYSYANPVASSTAGQQSPVMENNGNQPDQFRDIYPTRMASSESGESSLMLLSRRPDPPVISHDSLSLKTGHLAFDIDAPPESLYGKTAGISIYRDSELIRTTAINAAGFGCALDIPYGACEAALLYKAPASEPREVSRQAVVVQPGKVTYLHFSLQETASLPESPQ